MEVILKEAIQNLGEIGDLVTVRPGYGRNYLVPQGKAAFATKENIKWVYTIWNTNSASEYLYGNR